MWLFSFELGENETLMQVLKLIGIAVVTFLIIYGIRRFLKSQQQGRIEAPFIIKGSNSGKNSIVVSQNPAEDNSITLYSIIKRVSKYLINNKLYIDKL